MWDEENNLFYTYDGVTLKYLHPLSACIGRSCVIHNQSRHAFRGLPLKWHFPLKMFMRVCRHGELHPDPDDMLYRKLVKEPWKGVHSCCGCCQ